MAGTADARSSALCAALLDDLLSSSAGYNTISAAVNACLRHAARKQDERLRIPASQASALKAALEDFKLQAECDDFIASEMAVLAMSIVSCSSRTGAADTVGQRCSARRYDLASDHEVSQQWPNAFRKAGLACSDVPAAAQSSGIATNGCERSDGRFVAEDMVQPDSPVVAVAPQAQIGASSEGGAGSAADVGCAPGAFEPASDQMRLFNFDALEGAPGHGRATEPSAGAAPMVLEPLQCDVGAARGGGNRCAAARFARGRRHAKVWRPGVDCGSHIARGAHRRAHDAGISLQAAVL